MRLAITPGLVMHAFRIGDDGQLTAHCQLGTVFDRELMKPENPVVIEAIKEFGLEMVTDISNKHYDSRKYIWHLKRLMARAYSADKTKTNLSRFLKTRDLLPQNMRDACYFTLEYTMHLPLLSHASRLINESIRH